jgi:thioredoxin-like negative regulator of GroEL
MDQLNSTNLEETIKGKVVILVYMPEVDMCKQFLPVFEQVSKDFKEVKFAAAVASDIPDIVARYKITSIPAVLMFSNSSLVGMGMGAMDAQALSEKVKMLLKQ